MKKRITKIDKALSLSKEIIVKLNDEQLGEVGGGLADGSLTCNGSETEAEAALLGGSCMACSCNDRVR
ncbi:hypothetical protein GCM10027422_23950 [Hymenobacter arcticus]